MKRLIGMVALVALVGCGAGEEQPWGGSSAKGDEGQGDPAFEPIMLPGDATEGHFVGGTDNAHDQWLRTVRDEVLDFQGRTPEGKWEELEKSKPFTLSEEAAYGVYKYKVRTVSFVQSDAVPSEARSKFALSNRAAVEITRALIPVPYDTFVKRLPPELWGYRNLARWQGGSRFVVETEEVNGLRRATRQYERMVIDPLPWTRMTETRIGLSDMTKAEVIEYGTNEATVYWRVYDSDNKSVDQDFGSVKFESLGEQTQVTIHSAHKLMLGGVPILPDLVGCTLKRMFTNFLIGYGDCVTSDSCFTDVSVVGEPDVTDVPDNSWENTWGPGMS